MTAALQPSVDSAPVAPSPAAPGQGFRALSERWTRVRVERVVALLHAGDRGALASYLAAEVPPVPHTSDPPGLLDLKGLVFHALDYRVDLGQVRFEGLNLWSARFDNVNLKGARFIGCGMGQARFEGSYLRGASFSSCDLHGVDFLRSNLQQVQFLETDLYFCTWVDCELDIRSFAKGLKEEHGKRWSLAAGVYKALRLNLNAAGDEGGASWAAYQQSICLRRDLLSRGHRLRWLFSVGMDLAWGYGQRPGRLLFFSILMCVIFGGLYDLTGVRMGEACLTGRTAPDHLQHLGSCIYYSFVTFTTVGYGDIVPCGGLSRALASVEALSGIFTMGLFVTANVRKLEGR